jgi:hypothetical protein
MTENRIFVRPAPSCKVRNPAKPLEFLAEQGEWVPRNAFWLRRLRDGSVVAAALPKAAKAAPTATGKE